MKIQDLPHFRRPREKLQAQGASSLSDIELIALIIRSGHAKQSALHVAKALMPNHAIQDLSALTFQEASMIHGIGPVGAVTLLATMELCRRYQSHNPRLTIDSTDSAVAQFHHIQSRRKEYFVAIYLNARHDLISKDTISVGTLDASMVHPRDVFAPALEKHAAFVIVGHNHPSGNTEPSQADISMTQRLIQAGSILGIQLLDHIIVSSTSSMSFKESGQL